MTELARDIINMLSKHGINYYDNPPLGTAIKELVFKYSDGSKDSAIQVIKQDIFNPKTMAEGKKCPCCEQHVEMHKKNIDSMMAYRLFKLYNLNNNSDRTYFHVEDDIKVPNKLGGGWAKLRHWGLIEQKPKVEGEGNGRTSGFWKITEKGMMFVEGKIMVEEHVRLYNGKKYEVKGKLVSINDCLKNKFNYNDLKNGKFSEE